MEAFYFQGKWFFSIASQFLAGFQVSYITSDMRKVKLPVKSAIFFPVEVALKSVMH